MTVRAAAGRADITPPVGTVLGGYGARTDPSDAVADPLLARAAVFELDGEHVAVVVCDLLGVSRRIVEPARQAIASKTGLSPTAVLIAATHTHAGPASAVTGDDPEWIATTVDRIATLVGQCIERIEPVTLKTTDVELESIGRNRRHPVGPLDSVLRVVVAERPDGSPVASLMNYACHATVLESDNLSLSADFPGAACRALERAVGGVAIYLQGACGDVNPVWVAHDRREVERIGGIVGTAAARAALEVRALGRHPRVINLSWSEEVAVTHRHGRVIEPSELRTSSELVEIERRPMPSTEAIDAELASLAADLAATEGSNSRRLATARRNRLEMEGIYRQWAPAGPGEFHKAEVQVLSFGPQLAIVGLPGEFFVETGWALQQRAGVGQLLVAGYANNYLGYIPTSDAFDRDGYEVGCARFDPTSAEAIVNAALDLLGSS